MAALDDLLALQALDTRIDQLDHQLSHLPVRAELDAATVRRDEARAALAAVGSRLEELAAEQRHLEDEVAEVERRAAQIEASLYDGSIVAHKDLEALQSEQRMLASRKDHLEDRVLGVMEDAEPVAAEADGCRTVVESLDAAVAGFEAQLEAEAGDVVAELTSVRAGRATAASGVPADLLVTYEALRTRMGGIAVARLSGARCEGCRMEIPSAQLEEVRRLPAEETATCPECGRLLVR